MQYLRALAAIAVMVSHTMGDMVYHGGPDLFRFYYAGAAGVDLFFVVSGFVMLHSAGALFGAPGGWRVFLHRRLARIVPLYWVATGVYALVQIGQGKWSVVRPDLVAASLIFWPYADAEGLHLPVYSIGWTLDFEMFFYAAFAAALPLRRPFGPAAVVGGLGALVLAGTFWTLPQPLRFWAQPVLLDFLLGVGLAAVHRRGWRLPGALGLPACALAAVLFAGATLAGFNAIPNVPERFPRWIAWGGPAALLVAGTVLADRPARPPRAWLVALGDASYAVYLLHVLVIVALRPLLPWLVARLSAPPAAAGWLEVAAVAAVTLPCAVLIHRGFERPVTRLLSRARVFTPGEAWAKRPRPAPRTGPA